MSELTEIRIWSYIQYRVNDGKIGIFPAFITFFILFFLSLVGLFKPFIRLADEGVGEKLNRESK
jgi:hypothetical protein